MGIFQDTSNWLTGVGNSIGGALTGAGNVIGGAYQQAAGTVTGTYNQAATSITDAYNKASSNAISYFPTQTYIPPVQNLPVPFTSNQTPNISTYAPQQQLYVAPTVAYDKPYIPPTTSYDTPATTKTIVPTQSSTSLPTSLNQPYISTQSPVSVPPVLPQTYTTTPTPSVPSIQGIITGFTVGKMTTPAPVTASSTYTQPTTPKITSSLSMPSVSIPSIQQSKPATITSNTTPIGGFITGGINAAQSTFGNMFGGGASKPTTIVNNTPPAITTGFTISAAPASFGLPAIMGDTGNRDVIVPGTYSIETTTKKSEPSLSNFIPNFVGNTINSLTFGMTNLPMKQGFGESTTTIKYDATTPDGTIKPVTLSQTNVENSVYDNWNTQLSNILPKRDVSDKVPQTTDNSFAGNLYNHAQAFQYGGYDTIQEKPLDAVKNAAVGVLYLAGGEVVGAGGAALTGAAPSISPIISVASKAIPYGLGGMYGYSVADRSTSGFTDYSPKMSGKLGAITTTEVLPMIAGGVLYENPLIASDIVNTVTAKNRVKITDVIKPVKEGYTRVGHVSSGDALTLKSMKERGLKIDPNVGDGMAKMYNNEIAWEGLEINPLEFTSVDLTGKGKAFPSSLGASRENWLTAAKDTFVEGKSSRGIFDKYQDYGDTIYLFDVNPKIYDVAPPKQLPEPIINENFGTVEYTPTITDVTYTGPDSYAGSVTRDQLKTGLLDTEEYTLVRNLKNIYKGVTEKITGFNKPTPIKDIPFNNPDSNYKILQGSGSPDMYGKLQLNNGEITGGNTPPNIKSPSFMQTMFKLRKSKKTTPSTKRAKPTKSKSTKKPTIKLPIINLPDLKPTKKKSTFNNQVNNIKIPSINMNMFNKSSNKKSTKSNIKKK